MPESERARTHRLAHARAWREANPEKMRAYKAAWATNNRAKINALSARRYWLDPEKSRARFRKWFAVDRKRAKKAHLKHHYGIELSWWESRLEAQGHRCDLCSEDFGERGFMPALDHDHRSGAARGVVHVKCNLLLGHFELGTQGYDKYAGICTAYLSRHRVAV